MSAYEIPDALSLNLADRDDIAAPAFVVNGRFKSHRVTGVQRYAIEITNALAYAARVLTPPKKLTGLRGHLWEQTALLKNQSHMLWSPCGSGPILRANQVVTIHDLSFIEHPEWFSAGYARFYQWVTPLLCRRVRHVIAVSEFTRQRIIDLIGLAPEKVTAIHNGVDSRFRPLDESGMATAKQTFNDGRPYVLFVGSIEPRKNLARLLEAWKIVRQHHTTIDLLVAGGSAKIYAESAKGNGADGVRFIGYVKDELLPDLYAGASVFVYPSLYEGFGLPVLEAMSCGTPVVTSSTTSLPEVAGDAAVLIDPESVESIADGISKVLANPALQSSMRQQGLKQSAKFTWERAAKDTFALLERVARDH